MNWNEAYLNKKTPWELDVAQSLEWLPELKNGSVLDLGCGAGLYAEVFQNRGLEVTGLDGSEVALEEARKRVPRGTFELFDLNKLEEYTGDKFDLVLDVKTLAFLENEQKYLESVRKLMKPDGWFILQVFSEHPRSELVAKSKDFPFILKDSQIIRNGSVECVTYFFQL